jgi:hypothetical protein
MDLDNVKELWQQYDKSLRQNAIINEKIMKNMLAGRSSSHISRFTGMEYLSLSISAIVLIVFVGMLHKVRSEMQIIVPYILSIILLLTSVAWNIFKLRLLSRIDAYRDNVVNTRERVERLRLLLSKEKIWSIALMPLVIFCLAPVLHNWIYGSLFLDHIRVYIPRIVAGYALAVVLTWWLYKTFYAKGIRTILHNLEEIESLKKEGL